jgi:hypothetical protein
MSSRLIAIFSTGVGLLSLSVPSYSHHATSVVYDVTQTITISGTIIEFRFVNPHTVIYLDVRGEDGKVVSWFCGLPSNTNLSQSDDWTKETLKPGDEITVTGAPARGGVTSVWVQQAILNGEPLLQEEHGG